VLGLITRCGTALSIVAALAPPVYAQTDSVSVGIFGATSDAPFFIADKKGYFRDEGIAAKLERFQSGEMMVAPLGTGELDVGAGSASAALNNAVARGIRIKIVADKASSPPGYGATKMIIRKDLVENGRFKSLKDIKGMKFAMNAPGVSNTSTLNDALKSVGLKYSDVDVVNFSSAMEHVMAMQNKSVDAALAIEPAPTIAVRNGSAVVVAGDDEISPYHQIAVLLYSESFAANRPELARKFMRAYLRAVRFYNDALQGGHLAGLTADEMISILTEYATIKDPAIYRAITPTGMNPDGEVNVRSLAHDLDFYAEQGLVKKKVDFDDLVDMSYAHTVVKELGPYKK
jgi:NitT/TauT family transport system substrate-binding protein